MATYAEARQGPEPREYDGAIELQERERLRVAFDLHDGPAQAISAAVLQTRLAEMSDGEELKRVLEELKGLLTFALDDVYGIIEHLRGSALEHEGLVPKLRAHVEQFTRTTEAETTLLIEGEEPPLTESAQIAVFRIVQEALSNARRHSRAAHISVTVALSPDEVVCSIRDDGKGFSRPGPYEGDGARRRYGLTGMTERARMIGGECVISSEPGRGTRVLLRVPVWRAGCSS